MAWKSISEINATQGMGDFLPYISEVTHFWFGRMLMIAIFIIFLFGYLRVNREDFWGGLAISSYVTFIVGLLFWLIGVVSGIDFGFIIGVTVVSSVILFMKKKE